MDVATRLGARRLQAVQRKHLLAVEGAIDGLLPAVQRLGGLLRSTTKRPLRSLSAGHAKGSKGRRR